MGKSFVFKTPGGRLVGFLQQNQGMIRCKAEAEAGTVLTLIDETGGLRTHTLNGDGVEQAWTDEGGTLVGAYALSEERLLFDSGAKAHQAALTALTRREKQKNAVSKPDSDREPRRVGSTAPPPSALRQEKYADGAAREWPQRRWPPPPCWQQAQYQQGKWMEGG